MQVKHFRFGRLSTQQVVTKIDELNEFLETVDVVGVPQVTGNDEEGTVLFVFFNTKASTNPTNPTTPTNPAYSGLTLKGKGKDNG